MITSLAQLDLNKTYTYSDYLTWQLSEYVELLRGKIVRMAAPSRQHQTVSRWLFTPISQYFMDKNCEVFHAPFDVRLTTQHKVSNQEITNVVQPDICVICDISKLDEAGCKGAPDWVIEILSLENSKKEMKNKFALYEENGVSEYWIILPTEKSLLRYILDDENR